MTENGKSLSSKDDNSTDLAALEEWYEWLT